MAGYIGGVQTHAPLAEIVFDRFHIERYLTRAVDEVRKQEFFRHRGVYRDVIRGKKWLLLTHAPTASSPQASRAHGPAHHTGGSRRTCSKEQFEHAWTYTTEQGIALSSPGGAGS
ncbi:MAG: transposase [Kofleriaceae bacterium]